MWKNVNDLLSNPKVGEIVNQRWFVFYMSCYETPHLVQHKGGNCFACVHNYIIFIGCGTHFLTSFLYPSDWIEYQDLSE